MCVLNYQSEFSPFYFEWRKLFIVFVEYKASVEKDQYTWY